MYNEDATRIPVDEAELWQMLREQFEYIQHVLWDLPVETREEALANGDDAAFRQGMGAIRYRDTGEQLDQRDHYLGMGRDLLPYIHQSLDEKILTPEFVQQWGKIMFCHGYIASYVFDDTDDLFAERNRRMGAEAQSLDRLPHRVFLARLVLGFIDSRSKKPSRKIAEHHVAKAIGKFIAAHCERGLPEEHDLEWFKSLLLKPKKGFDEKNGGRILSTISKMSESELRQLASTDLEGLTSVEMVLLPEKTSP